MNVPEGLILEQIPVGQMENFCYLVGSSETREVVLVDPAWEIDQLLNHIQVNDYRLVGILATHYHPDHVGGGLFGHSISGIVDLIAQTPVKTHVHKYEADGLKTVTGLSESDLVRVESGDTMEVGGVKIEFLHTPGHTPGSQCFRVSSMLVSGDTLFIDGCGRVDLPGSNKDDMYHSLQQLKSLPDETILLPGHHYSVEPTATLGETKQRNAYLKIADLATWNHHM